MTDHPDISEPAEPSTAYLDITGRAVRRQVKKVQEAEPTPSSAEAYPGQRDLWRAVDREVDAYTEELTALADDLHAHPELAFAEHRSMAVLADAVERHGYPTQRGVHGVETAFAAEWSAPDFDPDAHPTVMVMAEYDALPGIGHGCGHNVIAAAGLGAFWAAASASAAAGLRGRIVLLGTPAEEGHTGKEYLIRGGCLQGVDAAVMMHGFAYDSPAHTWVGRRFLRVRYTGVAAHASAQPFMGRNALDAVSLAYQGLGLVRQQMPPSDRLHTIITSGGDSPNVIPNCAEMELYVRSSQTATLIDLSERVANVLDGAALMTGCGVEVDWDVHPMSLPVRNNSALVDRFSETQRARGRVPLPAGTLPESLSASTDFGNVSHLVPGLHPMVKMAASDVALHTEDFAAAAGSPAAHRAVVDSAAGLGQVVCDLLADGDLLAVARADFERAGGVQAVADLER